MTSPGRIQLSVLQHRHTVPYSCSILLCFYDTSVLRRHQVAYDFQYYNMDMPADVSILVLSEARSRILPCDVALPVVATAAYAAFPVDHPELDSWRQFIEFARQLEHHVESTMQTVGPTKVALIRTAVHSTVLCI